MTPPTISSPSLLDPAAADDALHPTTLQHASTKSWEDTNREAKALENALDTQLLALSRLTSAALRSGRGSSFQGDAEELAAQIEGGLKQLAGLIEALGAGQGDASNNPPSTAHLLQRHRDIHMDYVKELRKAKTHLAACLQPPSTAARGPGQDSAASDYLLKESDRLTHASGIADHILNMASASQKHLMAQRSALIGTYGRAGGLSDRFPNLDRLLSRIRLRRRRDSIVLAAFTLLLLSLVYLYLRSR